MFDVIVPLVVAILFATVAAFLVDRLFEFFDSHSLEELEKPWWQRAAPSGDRG